MGTVENHKGLDMPMKATKAYSGYTKFVGQFHKRLIHVGAVLLLPLGSMQASNQDEEKTAAFIQWAEELASQATPIKEVDMQSKIPDKKCQMEFLEEDGPLTHPRVLCFVSFSMPTESLIEISKSMQKVGGSLIIRGLPKDSFKELAAKLVEMRNKRAYAPVLVDPKAFKTYQIEHVPTFVVFDSEHYDKISGNVSLDHVLTRFVNEGDAGVVSRDILLGEGQ